MRHFFRLLALISIGFALLIGLIGCVQRRLLFFPSHDQNAPLEAAYFGMTRWEMGGEYAGYARLVGNPRKIWLVLHGNGGEAAQRGYVMGHLGAADAVYVLEYPGYGSRSGTASRETFDAAALRAYEWLVRTYGAGKISVLGESLGSGPACALAHAPTPPRQIVLVVPFDVLTDVAQEKFSFVPVKLLMRDRWNNVDALRGFKGKVDIFGAASDNVIPVQHARRLAQQVPGAVYHEFSGDHGWSRCPLDFSNL
jgi:hypothetical protein